MRHLTLNGRLSPFDPFLLGEIRSRMLEPPANGERFEEGIDGRPHISELGTSRQSKRPMI